jgi:hypothetical protein
VTELLSTTLFLIISTSARPPLHTDWISSWSNHELHELPCSQGQQVSFCCCSQSVKLPHSWRWMRPTELRDWLGAFFLTSETATEAQQLCHSIIPCKQQGSLCVCEVKGHEQLVHQRQCKSASEVTTLCTVLYNSARRFWNWDMSFSKNDYRDAIEKGSCNICMFRL